MRTEDINLFLKAADKSSLSKAAETLNISNQGLGKAIFRLEKELGCSLFKRSPSGIELSDDGKTVKKYFENIVCELDCLNEELIRTRKQRPHVLQIIDSDFSDRIKDGINRFNLMHNTDYSLSVVESDGVREQEGIFLKSPAQYRFCSRHNCVETSGLEFFTLLRRVHYPVAARTCNLAEKDSISIYDLDGFNILTEGPGYPYLALLSDMLQQSSVSVNFVYTGDKDFIFKRLRRNDRSVFFASRSDIDKFADPKYFSVLNLEPSLEVEIGVQTKISSPDMDFIEYIRSAVTEG